MNFHRLALQHSTAFFLDTYDHDHALHIWRTSGIIFSFRFVSFNLIGSGGRDVITAFTGRLSCMEVHTYFEGYVLTTLISMYSSYPLCFFFGSSTVDSTWVLLVFVLLFKIFPEGFSCLDSSPKKRGLFYHLSQRCVSYCMLIFDCRKRLAFVSLLPIIIGEIVSSFSFFFSAIPDTTRLCLAVHPAPISAVGPPLVRYLMTA